MKVRGIKGVPYGRPCPFQEAVSRSKEKRRSGAPRGERPSHWACAARRIEVTRAFRRFTAAFSLDPETAFWERTGAPIRYALDSAEFFALRSSAPTSPLPDGPM